MHHLVHYPHYIERFGPLKNYWCMRFEAKHATFKTMARTTGNFINLPFTLAKRHHIWVIHQIGKSIDDYLTQEILMSEGTKVLLSSLSYANQLLQFLDSNSSTNFLSLSWIKVNTSHVCAKKTVLLCPTRGSLSYKFGLCCDIVKQKGTPKVFVICLLLRTVCYNTTYEAYEVEIADHNMIAFEFGSFEMLKLFTLQRPENLQSPRKRLIVSKENLDHFVLSSSN